MNDFKEYSAAFMDHQDDLAHYGVKGMKWHNRKAQVGGAIGLVGSLIRANRKKNRNNEEEQQASRGSYYDSDRVNRNRGTIAESNRRGRYADSQRAADEKAARKQEVAANRQSMADLGNKLSNMWAANKNITELKKKDEKERKRAAAIRKEKEARRRQQAYRNNAIADRETRKRGRH